MNCIGAFTPEDAELSAYADGAASLAVQEHVAACPACHVRAHELEREQRRLQWVLYRAGCPSSLQLGEYYLQLLSPEAASEVAVHVPHCSACRAELEELAGFLASVRRTAAEAAEDVFGALRRVRATLSFDPSVGGYAHLAPSLRGPGGGERAPFVYAAEDMLVTVDCWSERLGQPGRIVAGLVVGPVDFASAEASIDADASVGPMAINEQGNFLFSDVAPGLHHLTIRLPATQLQIEIEDLPVP